MSGILSGSLYSCACRSGLSLLQAIGMACRSVPVTALVVFIVFCGTPVPCWSGVLETLDSVEQGIDGVLTLGCWRFEDLQNCVRGVQDRPTRFWRRQEAYEYYKARIFDCVEGTRRDNVLCKNADSGQLKNFLARKLRESLPPNNARGVTSPASIMTPLVSLFCR